MRVDLAKHLHAGSTVVPPVSDCQTRQWKGTPRMTPTPSYGVAHQTDAEVTVEDVICNQRGAAELKVGTRQPALWGCQMHDVGKGT